MEGAAAGAAAETPGWSTGLVVLRWSSDTVSLVELQRSTLGPD